MCQLQRLHSRGPASGCAEGCTGAREVPDPGWDVSAHPALTLPAHCILYLAAGSVRAWGQRGSAANPSAFCSGMASAGGWGEGQMPSEAEGARGATVLGRRSLQAAEGPREASHLVVKLKPLHVHPQEPGIDLELPGLVSRADVKDHVSEAFGDRIQNADSGPLSSPPLRPPSRAQPSRQHSRGHGCLSRVSQALTAPPPRSRTGPLRPPPWVSRAVPDHVHCPGLSVRRCPVSRHPTAPPQAGPGRGPVGA